MFRMLCGSLWLGWMRGTTAFHSERVKDVYDFVYDWRGLLEFTLKKSGKVLGNKFSLVNKTFLNKKGLKNLTLWTIGTIRPSQDSRQSKDTTGLPINSVTNVLEHFLGKCTYIVSLVPLRFPLRWDTELSWWDKGLFLGYCSYIEAVGDSNLFKNYQHF